MMTKDFRWYLLGCAAGLAITPVQAYAQTATTVDAESAQATSTADSPSEIVVTGTRIRRDGYDAPIPLRVMGEAEINAQKPANIADLLYTLPAVSPNTLTAQSGASNASAGNAGINTVNLRGLGAGRTLMLIDGRRTPPSTFNGLVDVNTVPQDLIQRVEIVTGGASAQYGSDAVAGVINFILLDKFKGLKLSADTGITDYGDGHDYRISGTAGLSFLDDRLHVLLNGSYAHQDAIKTVDRPWNNSGYQVMNNPLYTDTNGQPKLFVGSGIGPADRTQGGLITSGPLKGTYFLGDGVTQQLNYGVTNATSAPWMIGGDWQITESGGNGTTALLPRVDRTGVFGRVSFDVTPDITLYGQFSWNRYHGVVQGGSDPLDLTISADNGYLVTQYPQVAAAMNANGLSSIGVGIWGFIYGTDNTRNAYRYLAGAKGEFSLFERPWSWDAYYQRGVTKTHEETYGIQNNARFALALDSVLSNGQVVCRSTLTDPNNGCVPVDLLGTNPASAASLAYVFGPEQPFRNQTFTQDVASLSTTGELFDLPGGPAAVALGAEWRKDKANGTVSALTANASPFYFANYKPNIGRISVKEAFVEASLPLFRGFNLDAAGRITHYSTSGTVKTWKVGANYAPVRDVKFRAGYSRDIRAPNMSELFLKGGGAGDNVILPANSPAPGPYFITSVGGGNPDLKPEKAKTLTAGVVVTPTFLPGFAASVDYWDIKVQDAIGSSQVQSIVNFCYAGFEQFCSNIIFSGGRPVEIRHTPVNFASQHMKGLDFEASYTTPLSAISAKLPGTLRLRAVATHTIKNLVDDLVLRTDWAGVIAEQNGYGPAAPAAGGAINAVPNWTYRVSANYEIDPFSINLVARGFSSGVYSNEAIECTSSCPASTLQHTTINNNHIKGAMYFDGSVHVKLRPAGNETTLSFIVNNIFNKDPVRVGVGPSGSGVTVPQTVQPLYNTLGRVFRVALTSKF